jgi:hypothetical protein
MDFTSKNLTAGQLNAIVQKLGGEEGAMRFLRGELLVRCAKDIKNFPLWKTITLGTGPQTVQEYREAFLANGNTLGDTGNRILCSKEFTKAKELIEVDLVAVTAATLGCHDYLKATRNDIYKSARERGLHLCPAEVGPQLRLQFRKQPLDQWINIGMKPIDIGWDNPAVLTVSRSLRTGDLWLDGDAFPGDDLSSNDLGFWVFVLPSGEWEPWLDLRPEWLKDERNP